MHDKILIVDDDRNICEILEFNLKNEGFNVEVAYSAEEALKKLSNEFSVILLDVMMSGMSGYNMAIKGTYLLAIFPPINCPLTANAMNRGIK